MRGMQSPPSVHSNCSLIRWGGGYDFRLIGVAKGANQGKGGVIDVCSDWPQPWEALGMECWSHEPALSFLYAGPGRCTKLATTRGAWRPLAEAAFLNSSELAALGSLGGSVTFSGGDDCDGAPRLLDVLVVCDPHAIAPRSVFGVGSAAGGSSCIQTAKIFSVHACPLSCGRSRNGFVCGGESMGVCKTPEDGGTPTCVCKSGFGKVNADAPCVPFGSRTQAVGFVSSLSKSPGAYFRAHLRWMAAAAVSIVAFIALGYLWNGCSRSTKAHSGKKSSARSYAKRLVLVFPCIFYAFDLFYNVASSSPLHRATAPNRKPSNEARQSPASLRSDLATPCQQSRKLGPWAALLDPCEAPLLPGVEGIRSGFQRQTLNAHEGNADYSGFLYVEGEAVYVVDESGPSCMVRHFLSEQESQLHKGRALDALYRIEVDGKVVLEESFRDLFMHPSTSASRLPTTYAYAVERGNDGTLKSGVIINVPVCANQRLRVSLSYLPRTIGNVTFDATDIFLQNALAQIAEDPSYAELFSNSNIVRFSHSLPLAWQPFAGLADSHLLAASAALDGATHGDNLRLPDRFLEASRSSADPSRGGSTTGTLKAGVPVILLDDAHGAGVVTALVIDFPGARDLLHSSRLRLRALWDGGGFAFSAAENGRSGPDVDEDDGVFAENSQSDSRHFVSHAPLASTARGWSNEEEPAEPVLDEPAPGARGGRLDISIGGMLGPTEMRKLGGMRPEYIEALLTPDYRIRKASERLSKKKMQHVGEGDEGFYITLPMPFWHSAVIELVFEGSETELAQLTGTQPGVGASFASRVDIGGVGATRYDRKVAGYLQGRTIGTKMTEGMKGNAVVGIFGQRGALAFLSLGLMDAMSPMPEGDVRGWVDGSPTPSLWESSVTSFFNGGSAYEHDKFHSGEALSSHDRVNSLWFEYGNDTSLRLNFWQSRIFLSDAPTFLSSFRLALEGLQDKYLARVRGSVLWYGLKAPPLETTDFVVPAEEWEPKLGAIKGASHGYSVNTAPSLDATAPETAVDTLRSVIPSFGEDFRRSTYRDYPSLGGVLLTRSVFTAPPGSSISFSLAIAPNAERVFLRRLVDLRRGPQRAALFVEGAFVKNIHSAETSWPQRNTHWSVDTIHLSPEITRGRSRLNIELKVLDASDGAVDRISPAPGWYFLAGVDRFSWWSEAQWEAVCAYPPFALDDTFMGSSGRAPSDLLKKWPDATWIAPAAVRGSSGRALLMISGMSRNANFTNTKIALLEPLVADGWSVDVVICVEKAASRRADARRYIGLDADGGSGIWASAASVRLFRFDASFVDGRHNSELWPQFERIARCRQLAGDEDWGVFVTTRPDLMFQSRLPAPTTMSRVHLHTRLRNAVNIRGLSSAYFSWEFGRMDSCWESGWGSVYHDTPPFMIPDDMVAVAFKGPTADAFFKLYFDWMDRMREWPDDVIRGTVQIPRADGKLCGLPFKVENEPMVIATERMVQLVLSCAGVDFMPLNLHARIASQVSKGPCYQFDWPVTCPICTLARKCVRDDGSPLVWNFTEMASDGGMI